MQEKIQFKNWKGSIDLPVVTMTNGITIRFFDPYDIRHAKAVMDQLEPLFEEAKKAGFETIIVPATKPVPYAWYLAYKFGFNLVVIRKEVKPYFPKRIEFTGKSITSFSENIFYIAEEDLDKVKGRNVVFFDDVLSTGGTYEACKRFLEKGVAACKRLRSIFVLKEGDAYEEGPEVFWCGKIPFKPN